MQAGACTQAGVPLRCSLRAGTRATRPRRRPRPRRPQAGWRRKGQAPERRATRGAARIAQRALRPRCGGVSIAVVIDDLDVVAVGIEDEGAVVTLVVDGPLARRAVVAIAGLWRRSVERIDGRVV